MSGKPMKTVTICGSMRFEQQMRTIAWDLETRHGFNVLQCVYAPSDIIPGKAEKELLAAAHYRKIDLSDAIYVVDIGGYIGESVNKEIDYARVNGKTIVYHSEFLVEA